MIVTICYSENKRKKVNPELQTRDRLKPIKQAELLVIFLFLPPLFFRDLPVPKKSHMVSAVMRIALAVSNKKFKRAITYMMDAAQISFLPG